MVAERHSRVFCRLQGNGPSNRQLLQGAQAAHRESTRAFKIPARFPKNSYFWRGWETFSNSGASLKSTDFHHLLIVTTSDPTATADRYRRLLDWIFQI